MIRRRSSIAFAAILLFCTHARADGKFFGAATVANNPGIKAQRAFIAYRDGKEDLIVQSQIDANSDTIGWLLPLPAEPDVVEACTAGALSALERAFQPHVVWEKWAEYVLWLSVVVFLFAAIAAVNDYQVKVQGKPGLPRSTTWVLGALFVLAIGYTLLPSLDTGSAMSSVDVMQARRVGVYDIAVIKGRDAAAVTSWLTSNGFRCPDHAGKVIGEYIADGWCFLAAKVAAGREQPVRHHPIHVRFAAQSAVYPMKLTGADATDAIQLDLFVAGSSSASAPGLDVWYANKLDKCAYEAPLAKYAQSQPEYYGGGGAFERVGHPDLVKLLWPGCTLSRLGGRLTPRQMTDDISLTWTNRAPCRARLFARTMALCCAGASSVTLMTITMIVLSIAAVRKRWIAQVALRNCALGALGLGAVCFASTYLPMNVVHAERHSARIWLRSRLGLTPDHIHAGVLESAVKHTPTESFPEWYDHHIDSSRGFDGFECSSTQFKEPGDYTIATASNGWRLAVLDHDYNPVEIAISSNGVPVKFGR